VDKRKAARYSEGMEKYEDSGRALARLLGATRARMLALLRRRPRSAAELGAALGITDTAVRGHLAGLQRDGLAEEAGVRATGGKPAQLYRSTAAAESLYPKAYAPVLTAVLDRVAERDGRDALLRLLREVGEGVGFGAAPGADASPAQRVRAAADALRALGGEVAVHEVEGGWELRGAGCPLADVVAARAETCVLVEALVGAVTRLEVRERCERGVGCGVWVSGG
jgi:predicted ArsR family transcriptional regulator